MKKEKVMEDLQYLHYQTQLEEQERDEFLANGGLLPQVRTQPQDSNQTSMGEEK
jgi:hypothetical protein